MLHIHFRSNLFPVIATAAYFDYIQIATRVGIISLTLFLLSPPQVHSHPQIPGRPQAKDHPKVKDYPGVQDNSHEQYHWQEPRGEFGESGLDLEMDEMLLFEEIPSVFSASKYEQKVTEAPSSISIVTADEIEKYGYRDFGEILQSIRGFLVTNDRNYKYLGIRGFGQPSDYSNRVLILINGRRTNDNIYDAPAIGNTFSLNIDLIERIEVVRGPSSSLYGTSAFFGVINVITKSGRDIDGWQTSVEYGSYNTLQPSMTYGKKLTSGVEILVSGSFYESDGDDKLDYNKTLNSPQNFDTGGGAGTEDTVANYFWWTTTDATARDLDHDRNKKLFAKATFKDFTLTGEYYYRNKAIPTAPWETIFGDQRQYSVDEGHSIDLKYDHLFDNQFNLSVRVNYNYYNYYGDYPYEDDLSADPPLSVLSADQAKGKWLYGEIQLSKLLLEKHKVSGGASFQRNIKQEQSTTHAVKPINWLAKDFYDNRDTFNWALFLQDDFSVAENLIINAGVRYDYFEEFGDTTNPRVALIYTPLKKHTIKAVYGEAFRSPNVYELYYNDGSLTQKSADRLNSETIQTYELIYEWYVNRNTRFTAVGFYYEMDNIISLMEDPADGLLVFVNSDDIEAQGLELELESELNNGITTRFSYTFQETENKGSGRVLTNSPKHLAKLNMTFPLQKDKISLGFEEIYVSKRRTLFLEKQEGISAAARAVGYPYDIWADDYFLLNVSLNCKKIWKDLDASISIYNLLDNPYSDPGASEHFQNIIEQNGRTYRLKLTYLY